jgi:hypothetical protein
MSLENLKSSGGLRYPTRLVNRATGCLHHFVFRHANRLFSHFKDPFADADEATGETNQTQNYIHIRIQRESYFSDGPRRFLLTHASQSVMGERP